MTDFALQVVVMGVSSTGKSVVAAEVADRLGLRCIEGDDHHSPENVAKMTAGTPLTDEDRRPWLESLSRMLDEQAARGASALLTCSALRRAYRDVLRGRLGPDGVFFVHLSADREVLRDRMSQRQRHFMPTSLLDSQLATLEPLAGDECGVVVDVSPPVATVAAEVARAVREALATPRR